MASTVMILTGRRETSSLVECKNAKSAAESMSRAFPTEVIVSVLNSGGKWCCFGDDEWRLKSDSLCQNVATAVLIAALSDLNDVFFGTFVFKFTGAIMRAKARNWFAVYQDEAAFEKVWDKDSDQAFKDMFHKPLIKGETEEVETSHLVSRKRKTRTDKKMKK